MKTAVGTEEERDPNEFLRSAIWRVSTARCQHNVPLIYGCQVCTDEWKRLEKSRKEGFIV